MSKGYLILAQNTDTTDFLKLAYVNALSIKLSQSTIASVSLVTDIVDAVPEHYHKVFDNVISIPWFDDALNSSWKIENRWKLYHVSPYDETVILDSDMLFLTDISHWWKYMSTHDICITNKVCTYRNETVIKDNHYRKAFINNDLPNAYSAFAYFKKTENSKQFWSLVTSIVKNWEEYYSRFLTNTPVAYLSIDIAFALAIKILGIETEVFSNFEYPTFVHMKSHIQGWKSLSDDWRNHVGAYFDNTGALKIGNYQQTGIFHYTEKSLITDEVLYLYENLYKDRYNG